jgi:hypothetical protein
MLEAAIVLQLVLRKDLEAAVIAGLLVFNAALALFSGKSRSGYALKSRLALNASVRRDGTCIATYSLFATLLHYPTPARSTKASRPTGVCPVLRQDRHKHSSRKF